MYPAPPVSASPESAISADVRDQLASLEVGEELDATSLVEELRGLVSVLVDQLAAGQVETLYSLEKVGSDVRRDTAKLHAAAGSAAAIAEVVAKEVSEQVNAQISELRDEMAASTAAFTSRIAELEAQIDDSANGLAAVSNETIDGVHHAGNVLIDALVVRIEGFFSDLNRTLTVLSKRDAALDAKLEARATKLVEHTEKTASKVTEALSAETARLAARDIEMEHARAESFVNLVEGLLSKTGGRTGLRDRVRDVLVADRLKREVEADVQKAPAPVAAAPVVPTPVSSPPAPAKKVPAKKSAAAKAPAAKRTPTKTTAKRAAPADRTAAPQEDTK